MPLAVKQGLRFNGLTDYVQLPMGNAVNPFTTPITINMTVTPGPDITIGQMPLAVPNGTNQRLYIAIIGGKWDLGVQSSPWQTITSNVSAVIGKVTNVQLTMNNGTASLYVDGVLALSKTYTSYTLSTNLSVAANGANWFGGKIHYFDITIGNQKSIYNLSEGTGTTVTDTSGSGNNGTITGATWLIKKRTIAYKTPSTVKASKRVLTAAR